MDFYFIKKNEHDHWIHISLGIKFYFEETILKFGTKFVQKRCLLSKTEKSKHYHYILRIWISLSTKFQFLGQMYPNRVFLEGNRKHKRYHCILHIRITLITNFTLHNFGFFGQVCPIWVFWVKNKKSEHHN